MYLPFLALIIIPPFAIVGAIGVYVCVRRFKLRKLATAGQTSSDQRTSATSITNRDSQQQHLVEIGVQIEPPSDEQHVTSSERTYETLEELRWSSADDVRFMHLLSYMNSLLETGSLADANNSPFPFPVTRPPSYEEVVSTHKYHKVMELPAYSSVAHIKPPSTASINAASLLFHENATSRDHASLPTSSDHASLPTSSDHASLPTSSDHTSLPTSSDHASLFNPSAIPSYPQILAEDFVPNTIEDGSACTSCINRSGEATVAIAVVDGATSSSEACAIAGEDMTAVQCGGPVHCLSAGVEDESDVEYECSLYSSTSQDLVTVSHVSVGQCSLSECRDLSVGQGNVGGMISISSCAPCNQRSISPIDIS